MYFVSQRDIGALFEQDLDNTLMTIGAGDKKRRRLGVEVLPVDVDGLEVAIGLEHLLDQMELAKAA